MKKKITSIGIMGIGFVGGAVRYWFERKKDCPIFLYDKYKKIGSLDEVNKADIIFICVPTPFGENGYDESAVWDALRSIKGRKAVVLKSTILPGSTDRFQSEFPQHKILFNPEFLVAKTANEDFVRPERQIVGYTKKSRILAKEVMDLLPKAPFARTVPVKEAEMIKYFGNTFLSTRVIFANQLYDLCKALGADYDVVKECAGADSRIGTSHFDVFHDGYRGYGGACLPKDTRALISLAKNAKVEFGLLEKVEEINNRLVKGNGRQEKRKKR